MPRSVSVLLPVHNCQATLSGTVQKILEVLPELSGQFEVVIIDDGSTDATIEIADELASRYPQVRAIRHGRQLGRAAALQTGLQSSSGDVVFLRDEQCGLSINEIHHHWHSLQPQPSPPRRTKVSRLRNASTAPRDGGFHLIYRRAIEAVSGKAGESGRRTRRPAFLDRHSVRY